MSTFRRRLMQKAKEDSILPEGCKRVFFLQANETQYIDTEHVCQPDEDIFIDFTCLDYIKNGVRAIMGWRVKGDYTGTWHNCISINSTSMSPVSPWYNTIIGAFGVASDNTKYTPESTQVLGNVNQRLQLELSPNRNEVLVNGENWGGIYDWTDQYGGNYTNLLFTMNYAGKIQTQNFACARIYEYWVKDSCGDYVQHLIPITDANGVACMYDTVSGKFHYNKGAGSFLFGTEAFLSNTGNSYIDTGVPLTPNLSYEIKFQLTSSANQYPFPIGAGISLDNRMEFGFDTTGNYATISRYGSRIVINDIDLYASHVVKCYPEYYEIDGEMGYWDNDMLTPSSGNLNLFRTSRQGSTYFVGYIFYCKIWDGNTLIRDFIPHYQDGEWGLFDKVANKFYASPNNQKFYGYIPE